VIRKIYFYLLASALICSSCKKSTNSVETEPSDAEENIVKDNVKILSVIANGKLINGDSAVFVILGEYTLVSHDSAEVLIGFNNGEQNAVYNMHPDAEQIIIKGSGSFEFTVKTVVKDWGTAGSFRCYANISPYPDAKGMWSPYSSDNFILIEKLTK